MRKAALFAAAILAATGSAHASCSFTVQSSPLPLTSGKFVFQSGNADLSVTHLFLYEFGSGLKSIIRSNWNIHSALNPILTPDGTAVLFNAVVPAHDQRDLFYWKIGSSQVHNLTETSDLHDEDVKLSADGRHIVWKVSELNHSGSRIQRGDFAVVHGVGQITNAGLYPTITNPGHEVSAPVFSPTRKYIYYFTDDDAGAEIWRYDDESGNHQAFAGQDPEKQYYYPVAPDLYDLLYVSWPDADQMLDKIYVYSKIDDHSTIWNAADCAADNSDPAPVDEDYFIYSRKQGDQRYKLYLGQISTGFSWSLDGLGVNGGVSGDRLGANYMRAAP